MLLEIPQWNIKWDGKEKKNKRWDGGRKVKKNKRNKQRRKERKERTSLSILPDRVAHTLTCKSVRWKTYHQKHSQI